MMMLQVGAFCFGLVVGWVTYRTLRHKDNAALSDIAAVIGAVGGAAVTAIWKPTEESFGFYCVGLAIGFFLYFIIGIAMQGKADASGWMMDEE